MSGMLIEEIEKLDRNFLTASEAAAAMGISITTFYRNRRKVKFPIVQMGRKIQIPKEPFLDYLRYGDCKKSGEGSR